ncbi:MAG: hypothetical protein H0X24_00345 [Ktedonobacterales bacterium]|nr:hypothetical protein [Ktedonobacterales bacterium]
MRVARGIEIGAGLLASLWGIGALIWVLFGPTYTHVSGSPTGGPDHVSQSSLLTQGIHPETVGFLVFFGVILASIGVSAYFDGTQKGQPTARIVLAGGTAFLGILSCLAILSFGVFLIPSFLFALVAMILSFVNYVPATDKGATGV